MRIRNALAVLAVVCSGAFTCAGAVAAPVNFEFHGSVTSYTFGDLSPDLPLGSNVDLSLTFNETWSDNTYSFGDNLGPVSGTMSIGSANFVFNGVSPYSVSYDAGGDIASVRPIFTGTGPAFGTGTLFGLYASFTPALTLSGDLQLGYGFTTSFGENGSVTNYVYANLTPRTYSITPVTTVPEPTTLSLMLAGLLAAGAAARRRRRA